MDRHDEVVSVLRTRAAAVAEKDRLSEKRAIALVKSSSTTTSTSIDAALLQRPSPDQVDEQWTRALIKKGLQLDLVDDSEFRKAVLLTARTGMSYTHNDQEARNDSKLPHKTKMASVCVPKLDAKLDEKVNKRVDGIVADTGSSCFESSICC